MSPYARLLLLAAAVSAAGCGVRPRAGPKIDPALALMTPPSAVALAGVRMDAVRTTGFYQRHVAARALPFLDEFAARTGLNPRTEVWEILFVFEPAGSVALVRGKFSSGFGGLEPRILEGAPRTAYKGYTLIGDEHAAIAFVNSSTAVTGPAPAVRAVLDRRAESRGIPAALEEQIRRLPPGAQVWAAAVGGFGALPVPREGNWANLAKVLAALESGAASLDLSRGAEFSARGVCASEPEARRLQDALNGLLGLARLAAPRLRPELQRFYDSLRIRAEGRDLLLDAALSGELVEELIPMIR
ncbi:MAG: hypothetical protein HY822_05950 [Acidobacteria bacterium]|nr:hypothetical protein [Acidobacteriota bacterium]